MEGNNLILDHAYYEAISQLTKMRDRIDKEHYDQALINLHLAKVELAIMEGQLIRKISPFSVL